jgi:hypothetical protein
VTHFNWTPKIGDLTKAGWVTVVLYLLAAGSCWILAQKLGLEDVGSIVIGIDPHPFAPIPKRKRHHTRYHRIVARILLEERALLGHLQTVTHDLERRARLRGMLPK